MFCVYPKWRSILLNASQASAIATLEYSSLVVNDEFETKTILEAVSQMAILGPSRWRRAYCLKLNFFFNLANVVKDFQEGPFSRNGNLIRIVF